jgi:pimeloyl-ACP methyl ester carboxylesterase
MSTPSKGSTLSPQGREQGEGRRNEGKATEGTRTLTVWHDRVPIRVHARGAGPALVYFHGPWGLTWGPFLDALARQFTVYAPEHPGTSPDEPEAIQHVDHLWDLVLCYDELLEQLAVREAMVVGHSFGAMVACEVAAQAPRRVKRLVLIDPIGLWRDDAPVINWMLLSPQEMPGYVFQQPESAAAKALFSIPADPEEGALARTRLTWAMGATGKFIWPIPDKGLKKRIHRVGAPTLLVWGEADRLVPRAYAKEFADRLTDTRLEVVAGAGHAPQLEQPEATARVVQAFLKI